MDNRHNDDFDELDLLSAELEEMGELEGLDAFDDLGDLGLDDLGDTEFDEAPQPAAEPAPAEVPQDFDDFDDYSEPTEPAASQPLPEPELEDDFDDDPAEAPEPEPVPVPKQPEPKREAVRPAPQKQPQAAKRPQQKPQSKQKPQTKQKTKLSDLDPRKLMLGLVILILLVLVIVLLCRSCSTCTACHEDEKGRISESEFFDEEAQEGFLPDMTEDEIQAELDRVVAEGMFNVSIASIIEFDNGAAAGKAKIANVPANHYYMSVDIILDETGETVYSSGGIKPGQYIEKITLNKQLEAGEYPATARFTAYDTETLEAKGHVTATLYLKING